ncbi:MAG: hypothetical protein JOZ10_10175 [Acidobacteria bacterium]|nr:hypothetical protein [Acidobacteriota bacterium]MBV9145543.1 hypothetical protein [Acidobacteriota bacterium]MBV9436656.1 hypothetical protein [Acidobacteriota bacterium]
MRNKTAGVVVLLLFSVGLLMPQSTQENPRAQSSAATEKDMRADLERLHALLGQMQKNAAFVSQGDTPLKHEFELEIEMWQIVLNDMDKKIR